MERRYVPRFAEAWETPFSCIAVPSSINPDVMLYNFLGTWRLVPKKAFLTLWTPADGPAN